MNNFQETLQDLLQEKSLSRLQLSKQLGVSASTIDGYFTKGYYPSLKISNKLAKFFDCSLDYLFGLSDDRKNIKESKGDFIENFDMILRENQIPIARALREMNMGEYNYYRWKKGQMPKTSNLIEIAKYFGVSIDYLVGKSDKK